MHGRRERKAVVEKQFHPPDVRRTHDSSKDGGDQTEIVFYFVNDSYTTQGRRCIFHVIDENTALGLEIVCVSLREKWQS
jgi:hypothetical protein